MIKAKPTSMRNLVHFFAIVFLLSSCGDPSQTKNHPGHMVSQKSWGIAEGKQITQYTFHNKSGMEVSIIDYGGIVTNIFVPDRQGKNGDVVLGYDSLEGYLQEGNPYFGCLVGRYANRIAKGKFILEGKEYHLACNNQGNSLHGGIKGFDKVVWDAKLIEGDSSLQLSYNSKDGEEGYPGNLFVKVIYTLTNENALNIEYTATVSDKATPVNLTNHSYFNLSAGEDSTILSHALQINADYFLPVDETLIPTGKLEAVKGTVMDFCNPKVIRKDINNVKGGFDNNWVLRKNGNQFEKVADLYHPGTGRGLEVYTTQPGLQFYSGNFLDGTLQYTKKGNRYALHGGLCLEAQYFPDGPNQKNFPNTILKPGETYTQMTSYKFYTK